MDIFMHISKLFVSVLGYVRCGYFLGY